MQQYLELLKTIKEKGTLKPAARAGMPGTISLFGYQFRHDLSEGFPALTTKQLYWNGVVTELLWFLKGDTNIKFLDEHGVRKMWHQDAYNYYCKVAVRDEMNGRQTEDWKNIYMLCNNSTNERDYSLEIHDSYSMFTFEEFCHMIKITSKEGLPSYQEYTLGDCGYQYGKLWRNWETNDYELDQQNDPKGYKYIDQIKELINGLKNNPQGRRHILTAWNPATLDKMALNACHTFSQFNCRPLNDEECLNWISNNYPDNLGVKKEDLKIPKYYLDCQMYQRSADIFLGVPLNIASYALLTHILCEMCNMIPGEMIYTYGDAHIYEDHINAVNEQLQRTPTSLPKLEFDDIFVGDSIDDILSAIDYAGIKRSIRLIDYNSQPKIEANLSTGLK